MAKTSTKKPRRMNRSLNNRNPWGPTLLNKTEMVVMNTLMVGMKTGGCLILLSNSNDKKEKYQNAYMAFTGCQAVLRL